MAGGGAGAASLGAAAGKPLSPDALLVALGSHDSAQRQQAEVLFEQAKSAEPDSLVLGLLTVVGNSASEEASRLRSIVLLRRLLTPVLKKEFLFPRLAPDNQQRVAAELLRLFEHEGKTHLQHQIGACAAKLAEHLCEKKDPASWPSLLQTAFRVASKIPAAGAAEASGACEAGLRVLKELAWLVEGSAEYVGELTKLLGAALACAAAPKVQAEAVCLACAASGEPRPGGHRLPDVTAAFAPVIRQLAAHADEDPLEKALQALVDLAGSPRADVFRASLQANSEPALTLAGIARLQHASLGVRRLAVEWLVAFAEAKPKWLAKKMPALVRLALEVCLELMLEVDSGDAELRAWAERYFDEEGEEDVDEVFHVGEESVDRLARAVGMEAIAPPLSELAGVFAQRPEWQARLAALAALRQTAEFVEEPAQLDAMARLMLEHAGHPHMRVRNAALHAIGQLANDQAPHFQESHHELVLPVLLRQMDDPVDRVAAMAMSAFVSFGETLDPALMAAYVRKLMDTVARKLQTTQHRSVREESITSIAVIAEVAGKDFGLYYDEIMPALKRLVANATGPKEQRLRGKAFECISLLGIAVGKERFSLDAREVLAEMMRTDVNDEDEVQREYIKQALERICHCFKKDFAPFLPSVMPRVLERMGFVAASAKMAKDQEEQVGNGDYVQVVVGEGDPVWVNTYLFEGVLQSVQLIYKFVFELEEAFVEWVPQSAAALLPLLSISDEVTQACDTAWSVALQTWALLIKTARSGLGTQSCAADSLPRSLLKEGLQRVFPILEREMEAEALSSVTSGIAECVKKAGPGAMSGEELLQLTGKVFTLMDASFQRSVQAELEWTQHKRNASATGDAEDDEDEDWDAEELRRRLCFEEVLAAVMEVAPAEFEPCLPECARRLEAWFQQKPGVLLALTLAGDMVRHLGVKSLPVWPIVMPNALRALRGQELEPRAAAAYVVNIAAPLPPFAEAAPEAFRCLAAIAGGPSPSRRDTKARVALDHAVAALLSLARAQPGACPAEVPAWSLVAKGLPLREDSDEAKKVHAAVADLVLEQHAGLLGGERRAHLGEVLGALAEIYGTESMCGEATGQKIRQVFLSAPRAELQALAGTFTEKQRKKIEKMVAEGQ
eukprot:TRINITY_DN2155_c2_g2_i1.p1 TRINITY_DN2155_c2_g2~~TRINITY_DN2155_c2_g2_i1.p1  ORF type:complete len:1130 (-),score=342.11 TRINITY_DN2155_c2_g2_i1:133-3522(-)